MAKLVEGRNTAGYEGPLVVFVIGMTINRWWAIHQWWSMFNAMPRMLKELYQNKDLGFLDVSMSIGKHGPVLIQYWRSYEDLERYARGAQLHLKAWREFNKIAAHSDAVGVYHETYIVDAGKYESIYVNTPQLGLGRVSGVIPAAGPRETSRGRLRDV